VGGGSGGREEGKYHILEEMQEGLEVEVRSGDLHHGVFFFARREMARSRRETLYKGGHLKRAAS